jgi:hypothetical protein
MITTKVSIVFIPAREVFMIRNDHKMGMFLGYCITLDLNDNYMDIHFIIIHQLIHSHLGQKLIS